MSPTISRRRTGNARRKQRGETTRRRGESRRRRKRRRGETTRSRGERMSRGETRGGEEEGESQEGNNEEEDDAAKGANDEQEEGETTRHPGTEPPHRAELAGSAPVLLFIFKSYCMYVDTNPRKASPPWEHLFILL
jgi:hypothetical protein